MTLIGKFVAKIALALGGSFVIAEYVLTPVYTAIMAAITSAGSGGDMAAWLELARIPDVVSVLFAAYGVRSAQKFVFRRGAGG
ncbi:hypothetical protein [Lysobacter firmicutimachus]|uniref:DUF2523 domain-containing protein n=1 Tax=Lysobacter firmicutimachus TaxID=1792846 RepID=A0ABU8D5F2_9GAMM